MSLRRTWAGSVVEVNQDNFFRWAKGWIIWTLEGRPRVPAHDHQAQHRDFPPPVKPWRNKQYLPHYNKKEG